MVGFHLCIIYTATYAYRHARRLNFVGLQPLIAVSHVNCSNNVRYYNLLLSRAHRIRRTSQWRNYKPSGPSVIYEDSCSTRNHRISRLYEMYKISLVILQYSNGSLLPECKFFIVCVKYVFTYRFRCVKLIFTHYVCNVTNLKIIISKI